MQEYPDTGFAPIDEEHRSISKVIQSVLDAVNSSPARPVLPVHGLLVDAVALHFAHEEAWMREIGYPLLQRHKEAHDLFLVDARSQLASLREKGLTPEFRRWAVGRLLSWFRFHIIANDVGLGLALQEHRKLAAPRSA